jgi:hypothetical protein
VIEPVTGALQQIFVRNWQTLDAWFDVAIEIGLQPLLQRIRIALCATIDACPGEIADWADARICDDLDPAIRSIFNER